MLPEDYVWPCMHCGPIVEAATERYGSLVELRHSNLSHDVAKRREARRYLKACCESCKARLENFEDVLEEGLAKETGVDAHVVQPKAEDGGS